MTPLPPFPGPRVTPGSPGAPSAPPAPGTRPPSMAARNSGKSGRCSMSHTRTRFLWEDFRILHNTAVPAKLSRNRKRTAQQAAMRHNVHKCPHHPEPTHRIPHSIAASPSDSSMMDRVVDTAEALNFVDKPRTWIRVVPGCSGASSSIDRIKDPRGNSAPGLAARCGLRGGEHYSYGCHRSANQQISRKFVSALLSRASSTRLQQCSKQLRPTLWSPSPPEPTG